MDLSKIKTIKEWSIPRNVSEVRSFMGLVAFYRKFVKNFSRIAYPIILLQKKGKKFIWTEKCQSTIEFLKEKLTTTSILGVPDPQK